MGSLPGFRLSSRVCLRRQPVRIRLQNILAGIVFATLSFASIPSSSAQAQMQTLAHHVRSEVLNGKAALVGQLPSDQQLHLSIVLAARNQAQLSALLGRLYDPSSPDYRKFLTVEQFADQFGASASDYQAVVSYAQANGLTVTGAHANRLVVPVSGTVAQISSAFNVRMNVYQHPTENRTFYSPDQEPSLALSVAVAHIEGLNNFALPRPLLVPGQNVAPITNVTGSGPGGSYLGSDMRAAYYGGTTLTGNGQAVGILEFDGYYLSDVNLTFSNAGQTNSVPINNVLLDGETGNPAGYDAEQVLDIVQAIGMAPGLSQARVYIGDDDADILSTMASENVAKQLSCSWSWTPDDPTTDDVFFQEFAAQGQSFFAASGDNGAYDASISPYFYPQEDAYVTAVGATHLTTNGAAGTWVSETAWNSSSLGSGFAYGSGGGISPDGIPIPSWQSGVASVSNGGSTTVRNVPDIAMEGDFDNYICAEGSCSGDAAGTSFAAPRWAGFMALVNQQAIEAGNAPNGGIGFVNPPIYTLGAGANYSNDFHDVTSGNNDTDSQPTWFNAVAGYDLVTGWGSANGQALIDALAGPQVPGFWIAASAPSVSVNQGASNTTTLSITDAGGFSGKVTLAITSALPTGLTASWGTNPTSGSSVLTLTASSTAPAATTSVTISGTSGSITETTTIAVSVHAPTFVLSPSPSIIGLDQGGSATSTITLTPEYGFAGSANLSVSGLPSGVTASWGTNPTSSTSVLTLNATSTAAGGPATLTITGTSGSLTVTSTIALTVNAPTFTLSASGSVNIGQGTTANAYVYVNDLYGFTGNVNLSISGLPTGVTASFSPNPTTGSSTLVLTASATASLGTSTITITGTSGSITATTTLALGVFTPTFTLSSSGTINIGQGQSSTGFIYVQSQYGFSGAVTFSLSGLPAGVTAVWSPNPSATSSVLTFNANSTASPGQYPLTITGTYGSQTATTSMTLGVYVPTFGLSGGGPVTVGQGSTGFDFISVNDEYGFSGKVSLAVSGLPSGVTGSFSTNPTQNVSDLTFTVGVTVPAGQYPYTITGTSGTQTATATGILTVAVPTFTVSSYGSVGLGQGTSSTVYAYVNSEYGFGGNVTFSISGLPNGVTASFAPNPTSSISTLTLTATGTATTGQYPLTITGTSGTQTATTILNLSIYVPTFSLSSIGAVTIGQGTSTTAWVYVNNQYGFTGNVTLAASGLPTGVTASFAPNPTTGTSTMTLTASSTAPLGQSTITITGTSGSQTATTTLALGVFAPTFTVSAGGVSMGQNSTATDYVNIFTEYGFTGTVNLSLSGLPSGVTGSFSINPATNSSTLTLTSGAAAPIGQYTVTLTGTSGSLTATSTFSLAIAAQSFYLFSNPSYLTFNPGASGTTTVSINGQFGFAGNVSLAASGLPSGVTASFSPNPTTGSSTLTLSASSSAVPGSPTITITGIAGALTASTAVYLTINTPGFTLSAAPSTVNLVPGATGKSTVIALPENGFGGSINLSIAGLPSGVTASFSANPIETGSSTVTLTAASGASVGTSTATITGASGSLSASAPLLISVGNSAPPATSSTSLEVTSSGSPVTSVVAGTLVTLTAAVSAGSASVTAGQVNFCEAAASSCDTLHRVGSAQLTGSGTAVFSLVPGPGAHAYQAVFAGTHSNAGSSSAIAKLAVTSSIATTTTIAQSGSAGDYSLTATVAGHGWPAPSGTISFLDTTNQNAVIGTATLGQSKSTFTLQNFQSPAAGSEPTSIATADFNGDGILDLAITNQNTSSLTILLGNGDGTFTASSSSPQLANPAIRVVTGDFNRDGKADLAVVEQNTNSVSILLGNGDGTFTASAQTPATGPQPLSMAVGDFNGDGMQDLAVVCASSSSVTVLLGNGDGTFTASPLSQQTGAEPISIVSADFNGDGIPDLAVAGYASTVTILLGNGDGSFALAASPSLGGTSAYGAAIAAADFNGDGIVDLAVTTQSGSIVILLGNGDGTFTASSFSPQGGSNPIAITAADLNGDGHADLAVANQYGNNISLFEGNGDGTFTSLGTVPTGTGPDFIAAGDLNGDGAPDLVVANVNSNSVTVLTSQVSQISSATASGISPVGQGQHSVFAGYPGDDAYKASTSGAIQLSAQPGTPLVTVTPSSSTVTETQPVSVTVTVSDGGNPTPTGSVVLSSGAFVSPSATLAGGTVVFNIPAGALALGANTLKAVYAPDAVAAQDYLAASGSASLTVTKPVSSGTATPTVTATPSAATITNLESDTIAVTVAGGSGQPTPSGIVVLSSGSYNAQQTLAAGSASFTVAAGVLASGANTITIYYSGDTTFAAATATSSITVASVAVTVPPPATVAPGSAATATATFVAGSGYSGTMNLTCALVTSPSGAQSLPTCSLNPASITLQPGASATTKLTVNTTGASSAALGGQRLWSLGSCGSALALVLMFGVSSRRRRWLAILAVVLFLGTASIVGCGGGGGGSGTTGNHGSGTPATTAGSYTFSVTGTDAANPQITSSVNVTIAVE